MQAGPTPRFLAVVAVPVPIEKGTRFPRATWPSHVTLASNFFVDAALAEVVDAVRAACVGAGPITIQFEGIAQFGRDKGIRVQLVNSAQTVALHEQLADLLEALPHFAAEESLYWRAGYRPHMTHVAGRDTPDDAELMLRHVVIADIDGADATVLDQFRL
ncbi:2'-5' RNA ligase family protein [Agromyces sp. NPDC056965]|uniref:2'-5' RNA ligase family protein n=1 Tax=Agromyces sp. NPDC056965 TaxID=3345983 RepID=UPI00363F6E89